MKIIIIVGTILTLAILVMIDDDLSRNMTKSEIQIVMNPTVTTVMPIRRIMPMWKSMSMLTIVIPVMKIILILRK